MDSQATRSGPGASGPDPSSEQIEALCRVSIELAAAVRRARQTRLALFLAVVAFVGVVSWAVIAKANQLTSNKYREALVNEATRQLDKNKDFYLKQVQRLVDDVSPSMSKAFLAQAQKDSPAYVRALEHEREPLLNNVSEGFMERLVRRTDSFQPRYEKLLHEEFPNAGNEKTRVRLVEHFNLAAQRLMKKYYVDELRAEANTMFANWDRFPPARHPKAGELPLEDQLVAALLELLTYRLTHYR